MSIIKSDIIYHIPYSGIKFDNGFYCQKDKLITDFPKEAFMKTFKCLPLKFLVSFSNCLEQLF